MEWSLAVGVWVEAAITPERTRRRNVDQDDNCAVRCHCSEHRRYSIGRDQETKSPSQRPTGSRHRPARRPTFRSLQSHQSLPSRSHRWWYPWLQSNARALLNYTDHGGGAVGNARRPLVAFFQIRTREILADGSSHVRFTPKSGHRAIRLACPPSANSGSYVLDVLTSATGRSEGLGRSRSLAPRFFHECLGLLGSGD